METNFGPNPFEDNPPDYVQHTEDIEYVPIEEPENSLPPSPKFPKNGGGAQWSSPLNVKKSQNEIPQETHDDEAKNDCKKNP